MGARCGQRFREDLKWIHQSRLCWAQQTPNPHPTGQVDESSRFSTRGPIRVCVLAAFTLWCWWESRRLDMRALRRQAPLGSRKYPRSHPQTCRGAGKTDGIRGFSSQIRSSVAPEGHQEDALTCCPELSPRQQDSPGPREEEGSLGLGPRPGFCPLGCPGQITRPL